MSFSRSFTFSVSGDVNYPASRDGGSISYSDSVDVTVNVDTSDFDASVHRCEQKVGQLRTAIIQSSVRLVKEKAKSAQKIANSLIHGFYQYIRYDIREKIMRLVTRIPMLLKAIKNLAMQCSDTRIHLENDYCHITSRYARIFEDLRVNLKTSLLRLDAPSFEIVEHVNNIAITSAMQLSATTASLTSSEVASAENAIEVAQVKSITQKVVSESARNIMYNVNLGKQIEHMLRKSLAPGEHTICMPVVNMEFFGFDGDTWQSSYVFSPAFPRMDVAAAYGRTGDAGRYRDGDVFANTLESDIAISAIDCFFRSRLSEAISLYQDTVLANRISTEVLRMWNQHKKS